MAELTDIIKVSNQVKGELFDRKKDDGHSSLDSVIRSLISDSNAYRTIKDEIEKNDKRINDLEKELKNVRKDKDAKV